MANTITKNIPIKPPHTEIRYHRTAIGRDPQNPLCDIAPQDQQIYLNHLTLWLSHISKWGQRKDDNWCDMIKRRPKNFSIGRDGPNSVLTMVSGLLCNYLQVQARVGQCRISVSQIADFEMLSHIMHSYLGEVSPPVQWRECLFTADGVMF